MTVASVAMTAACVRQLSPAPTPPPIAPPVAASAPAEGQGRLVIDVTDGAAPVQRVDVGATAVADDQGRVSYRLSDEPRLLCPASPCVLDTAPGNIALGFPVIGDRNAQEIEVVHVAPGTSVYRRTLSVYENKTGALRKLGIVGTSVGGTALVTGIVLLPIGLGRDHDGLTTAGGITLGVGALVTAFGIWAIRRDSPTFRPGASNHFAP